MPYIKQSRRNELVETSPERELETEIRNPGELNFVITAVILEYQHQHCLNYVTINDIMGALESAKQEYYRRVAVPYENLKRSENGDVYE